jgi:L-serine dehydratase
MSAVPGLRRDVVAPDSGTRAGATNGMIFRALESRGGVLQESTYYSVGGGFVVDEHAVGVDRIVSRTRRRCATRSTPSASCWRSAGARRCGSATVMLANERS